LGVPPFEILIVNLLYKYRKMNPEIDLGIELMPIVVQDKKTGYYVAYFEQFPRASASAKTALEAKEELMEIFTVMLRERKEDITRQIVDSYFASREQTPTLPLNERDRRR
jgi:predicted RNase H-like HicB family nuclease